MIDYLAQSPTAFIVISGLFGLMVGSFLNVVILRLPVMMERAWQRDMVEGEIAPELAEPFDLVRPRSHCPKCGHMITALENIPVLSYLVLRGKCSACGVHIPLRYPLIELTSAILSAVVAWQLGFGWPALAAIVLTWALLAASAIDFDHQLLPDSITLPFLWLGLVLSLGPVFADSHSAIIGALAGYLSLWSIYWLFKLITAKEGMGYGDFKLFALLGAWMGWQMLPLIILLSSVVGAAVGITLILLRGRDRNIPIPFGPYLAAAGWIALLWGEQLVDAYLATL